MTENESGRSIPISTPHAVIAEILEQERTRPRPGKPNGLSKAAIPRDVCARSTYNALIRGTYPKVNPSMIRDILEDVFRSPPELVTRARELARSTQQEEPWYETYKPGMTDTQWLRIRQEERASHIISHSNNNVPTLAQCPEYLDALFESLKQSPVQQEHEVDLDAAYRLRLDRLERWEESERRLTCVIGEAALHINRGTGVPEAQIRHLLKLHKLPHVEIFVVPFSAGRYSTMHLEFNIFEFDDGQESITSVTGHNVKYLTTASKQGQFYQDGLNESRNLARTIEEHVNG